ncbi:MAG: DUF1330 domain-containing protein [Henriciella sp.]|nr:DUF1330 domain-containing protein [Henriciella sp.]
MRVTNEVVPSDPKQMEGMQEQGPEGPIFMVNLLKFKDKAEYADGRETDLTGRQAYQLYGAGVAGLLPEYGGRICFVADVTFLSLGQVEELWDEVAIAAYPDRNALFRMSTSQAWQDLAVHRAAGLAGQLNIETVMPAHGKALPWMALLMKEFEG